MLQHIGRVSRNGVARFSDHGKSKQHAHAFAVRPSATANPSVASRRYFTVPLIRSHRITTVLSQQQHLNFSTVDTAEETDGDRFENVGMPFEKAVSDILTRPVDSADVIILKNGTLILSDEYYKNILTEAFGMGGWALIPVGEIKDLDLSSEQGDNKYISLMREYSLYCHQRFVSQAMGETPFFPGRMNYSDATEKIKASALARCCKDLGIASELWNKRWIEGWKKQHAVQEWVENESTKRKSNSWRRKNEEWSWPFSKASGQNRAW